MDPISLGILGLVILITLIAIRIPIAYAMILVGGVGVMILNGPLLVMSQLKTLGWGVFSNYGLSVVPMFVLMGNIAFYTGMTDSLFKAARLWLGRLPGGLAVSIVVVGFEDPIPRCTGRNVSEVSEPATAYLVWSDTALQNV